jgi:hypothetical protein
MESSKNMRDFVILAIIVWSILLSIELIFGKLDYEKITFWCLLMYFILDNLEMLVDYLKNRKNLNKQD